MKFALLPGFLALASVAQLHAHAPGAEATSWSFGGNAIVEGGASLHGGRQSGDSLSALGLAHVAWSGPRLGGAIKLEGYASAMVLAGSGPTERFAGNFLTASNIEGHRGPRVYSWWLEAATEAWSLRAGSLLADEEFGPTQVGGNFRTACLAGRLSSPPTP